MNIERRCRKLLVDIVVERGCCGKRLLWKEVVVRKIVVRRIVVKEDCCWERFLESRII